jgi:WXG100 family type VII secretion target
MSNAPIIQGQYEVLTQTASRFGKQSQAMTQVNRTIQRSVGNLRGGGWAGVGADAFLREMESVTFPALQRLINALNEAQRATLQIRDTLQSAEEAAAFLFRERDTVAIPFNLGALAGTPPPPLVPTPNPTPTETPTAPPTSGPPLPTAVYEEGYSISDLAGFQENQGMTNNCGEYAAAAALDMLFGGNRFTGTDLTAFADASTNLLPWLGRRMFQNGPTMPPQQANLINDYAAANHLPVEATATTIDREGLIRMLETPDQTLMVTISYGNDWQPTLTSNGVSQVPLPPGALPYSGHVMVLAAYEENGGNPRWGFVNSWVDGGSDIYWMTDADFQRAWNYDGFMMGNNNVVVVRDTTNDPPPTPAPPTPELQTAPEPENTIVPATGTPEPITP